MGELRGIPTEDLVALRAYTSNAMLSGGVTLHGAIDNALRSRDLEQLNRFRAHIRVVLSGLNQLPPFLGLVFRAATTPVDGSESRAACLYTPGSTVREASFVRATSREDVEIPGDIQFTISSNSGRGISFLSYCQEEAEVLFRPGIEFVVLGRNYDPEFGSWHVVMREVDAPDDGDREILVQAGQSWIRRRHATACQQVSRPGRFDGPPIGGFE